MDIPNLAKSRFLKWVLVVAIVIVLNLFFVFSVELVYKSPDYENFCPQEQVHVVPETKDECITVGGQWVEGNFIQKGLPRPASLEPATIQEEKPGYCNEYFTCSQSFSDAQKVYERNFFVALVILGTITLIGGMLLRIFEVVSASFGAGGVLTLVIASVRYWSDMNDYLRVIVLGIALAALIFVGIKWF